MQAAGAGSTSLIFARSDGAMSDTDSRFRRQFFHGTRADLQHGDLIIAGYISNYGEGKTLSWVYCTGTLDAAIWGAELAAGDAPERIYIVEPTGPLVDDPNLTNKKFPGNPTLSYRSRDPLRVVGEVAKWQGHSSDQLQQMRAGLERLKKKGSEIID
jgi:Rifampin ADP-ribosyl transferase